ncbi:MAG: HU family DNA-binding protein [Kiritimatiellia bacterium]
MTKAEMITEIAEVTGIPKVAVRDVLDAFADTVLDELEHHGKASVLNLGSLKVKDRAERLGRNPRTGEVITIRAHKAIVYSASVWAKEAANG